MFVSDKWQDFELIDCSKGEKLERWGSFYLVRPDPQAIWETPRRNKHWNDRHGRYQRSESGGGSWDKGALPENWKIRYGELTNDEFFITEKAAKEGVLITNTSATEPIVMLKHFAENPELVITE